METYTKAEVIENKKVLFTKMRADEKMLHISDDDIHKMIDILYKLEVKHGFMKVSK